jgi:hypothetical protein
MIMIIITIIIIIIAIRGTSHISKVLLSENWSLSGGVHSWFKGICTGKRTLD